MTHRESFIKCAADRLAYYYTAGDYDSGFVLHNERVLQRARDYTDADFDEMADVSDVSQIIGEIY